MHVCANVCGIQNLSPPCPVATSWEQSSCSPGCSQCSAVVPHPNCAGWGRASSLAEENKAPFSAGPRGKAVRGWAVGEHSGVAAQQDHLPSVGCPPLPPPSSFRLRVHHSGDPWEFEANFPRSLVMERPQVLPLIKVKRGTEETRCTPASFSHL